MKKFHKPLFFLALFFCLFAANAQDTIYQIDIDKEIGSTTRIGRSELLAYMGTPIDKILAHFVPEPYTQACIEAINR